MTRWWRSIHAHPELGFEEDRTPDVVAERLRGFGLEVHEVKFAQGRLAVAS